MLSLLGRTSDAVVAIARAVKLSPNDATTLYNFGKPLKEPGRFGKAKESYNQAMDLKPDYPKAHSNLGFKPPELCRLDEA